MPQPFRQAVFSVLLLLVLLTTASPSQSPDQDNDSYLKTLLRDYYTGKIVRAKVAIPTSKHGLEIVDGQINAASQTNSKSAVQPGDPLLITQFQFSSKSIDIEFSSNEAPPAKAADSGNSFTGKTSRQPAPRLRLQFSHEITTRDLNIQTINRLLAAALDVSALTPKTTPPAAVVSIEPRRRRSESAQLVLALIERRANAEGIPTAPTAAEDAVREPGIGELVIVSLVRSARVYIDGAFSGQLPRTVRILAGVHSILVTSDGYSAWGKKYFIPAGKLSAVSADLQPITSRK